MNISTLAGRVAACVAHPLRKSFALVAMLGGIAATVAAMAQSTGGDSFHHVAHRHMAAAGTADVAGHVDGILQHIYVEVGASPAQQAQIAPLVQATATNLLQLHDQFHTQHAQMLALLTHDPIDRVALENSRAAQVSVIDQASRQVVQLIADTADVLTPGQRKALAEKLAAHLGSSQD